MVIIKLDPDNREKFRKALLSSYFRTIYADFIVVDDQIMLDSSSLTISEYGDQTHAFRIISYMGDLKVNLSPNLKSNRFREFLKLRFPKEVD